MKKIGVLVSVGGTNLQALIDAQGTVIKNGEIVTVVSNKEGVYALERAKNAGIDAHVITRKECGSKEAFDIALRDYMQKMGFNIDTNDFDEQYAIGGKGLQVSCEQLAGAYATLFNNGYYNKPHTISKIEFLSDKAPYTAKTESYNLLSEQSCFLM